MDALKKHLIPNAGTLVILGLFLWIQSAGAKPPAIPLMPQATTTLLSYQGTLTNKSGVPINGNAEMVFALYHQATGGTSFWTESYTSTQAIAVTNGQFHVLLGSRTPLNPANLTGDLYLGIKVNGEETTPREQLVSVPDAVQANGIAGDLDMRGYNVYNVNWFVTSGGAEIGLQGNGGGKLIITNNTGDNKIYMEAFSADGSGSASELLITGKWSGNMPLFTLAADETNIMGSLDMNGHSISNCGALTEANLQTEEERVATKIDRFEEGDVLCWANDQLEKCGKANDLLIQAVADTTGKPIVIGAEVIKVLGPVRSGDLLVASNVSGYAMVNNAPRPATVIAQALEDFDGEQGLVKAMIRKF